MINLAKYIFEKLKLNSSSQSIEVRNLDEIAANRCKMFYINSSLLYINNNRFKISDDVKKRHDEGKKPETLLRTKDSRLIATRWFVSVLLGYEDYYDVLRTEIINRSILEEDFLDAFIRYWHKRGNYYGDKKFNDAFDKYLKTYNVKTQ